MTIEDKNISNEPLTEQNTQKPGEILRFAREKLGLSQQEIATQLRLNISVVKHIENDEFNKMPVATFTRGYLRSYAKLVNVETDDVLKAFDASGAEPVKIQEMQSFSKKRSRDSHDSRVMGITWVLVIIVVGITATWWWQNKDGSLSESISETQQLVEAQSATSTESISESEKVNADDESVVSQEQQQLGDYPVATNNDAAKAVEKHQEESTLPEVTTSEVNSSIVVDQKATASTAVTAEATTPETIVPDTTAEDHAIASQVAEVASVSDIQMTFSNDCWVQITDASGKNLVNGIKKQGDTIDLSGNAPYKIVLGAPNHVELTYKGDKFDLSRYASGKVARFKLSN
ncbi:cytoskeleton protein RodZ [Vibrio sp. SS-MA-C1-2]|uniref:cytoskeleton protein RodZ n=1 Tax=Vibrio sp. SS-MA-C1-2 TaxID=2908646 RepID=UPI001F342DA6|nr:cytoskeleton protein RodZ [Vibrio sp. SS-MA-C1-2]UJF18959.1 cytoskeleton protein RodZ [Vibrio sp. SS-MA-C1-2]